MPVSPMMNEPLALLGFDETRRSSRWQLHRSHQPDRRDRTAVAPFGLYPFLASRMQSLSKEILRSSSPENDLYAERDDVVVEQEQPHQDDEEPPAAIMSSSMIGAIGFYKYWISPLLPPACRFVPTCSMYGIQAIKEFGPNKGAILTAWRILRCSPFGGKGYDPPKWPPVFYTYSSY
jgi:uncharacterized protein